MNEELIGPLASVIGAIRDYHSHRVVGIDHIPRDGRTLLVVNHSLATYDIALLFGAIYEELGRIPRPLADNLFFKVPLIGEITNQLGAVQGTQNNAQQLLLDEELVAVAPGGMREALRPSEERYQIRWEKRLGFAKLAIAAQAPVVLAVCPKADDLFHVYSNPITKWAYQNFKVPLVLARGLGLSPIPRPVVLTHFVGKPIAPPPPDAGPAIIRRFHRRLVKEARDLIGDAIAYRR